MHGNLIDYMLLGNMGHWDMQRALRIGQEENFIKVFFYILSGSAHPK